MDLVSKIEKVFVVSHLRLYIVKVIASIIILVVIPFVVDNVLLKWIL